MVTEQGPELRVAVAAYEAATNPTKWKDVLRELANQCGAAKAALFTPVEGATQRFLWSDIEFDPEHLQQYSTHWVNEDAWIAGTEEHALYAAGNVNIASSYLSWDRLEKTAFYNEFAVPADIKGLITAILFDERDAAVAPRTHLSLFRRLGEPEFQRSQERFLRRVQPHLRKALEIYWALAQARGLPEAIKQCLDGVPEPILLLRGDGTVEFANAAGNRLLSLPGLLRVRNGRLIAIGDDYRPLAAALHQVIAGVGCALPFTHINGDRVLRGVMRLAPAQQNPSYQTVWPTPAGATGTWSWNACARMRPNSIRSNPSGAT